MSAAPLAFKVPVPRVVVPSTKVTVPVGTMLPTCGATFAVNVTLCPGVIWVADADSVVVVAIVDRAPRDHYAYRIERQNCRLCCLRHKKL